jgi:hypothetical protein
LWEVSVAAVVTGGLPRGSTAQRAAISKHILMVAASRCAQRRCANIARICAQGALVSTMQNGYACLKYWKESFLASARKFTALLQRLF